MKSFQAFLVLLALFRVTAANAQDYRSIVLNWYTNGVEAGNGAVVMNGLADDIQWWCFGPAGFAMNDYYQGKTGANGVGLFFQRLQNELVVDTQNNFHINQVDVADNVVTVYGLETGQVTDSVRTNAPALQGDTFYNYFTHRLELNGSGQIEKFRCNWGLSDHPYATSPN